MKRLKTPGFLLLSFLMHAVIIGFVYILHGPSRGVPSARSIAFDLQAEPPRLPEDSEMRRIPTEEPSLRTIEEAVPSKLPDERHRAVLLDPIADFDTLYTRARLQEDSSFVFNQDAWKQNILDFLKREKLLSIDVSAPRDSNRLVFSPGEFTIPPAARDGIAEMLNRQTGGGGQFSATELIASLAKSAISKETPPRFDFLPSRVQVASLAHLYENRNATQMDLYPAVDAHATTAEHLDRNLEHLVKKGWLRKKKISPQNILSFFGIPIEMSPQNSRNPLYIYEPQVDRSTLIAYLQSRLYLLKEQTQTPADSIRTRPRIESLQRQIQALLPR